MLLGLQRSHREPSRRPLFGAPAGRHAGGRGRPRPNSARDSLLHGDLAPRHQGAADVSLRPPPGLVRPRMAPGGPLATQPDQRWHLNVLYLWVLGRWYFLVTVIDAYSRHEEVFRGSSLPTTRWRWD